MVSQGRKVKYLGMALLLAVLAVVMVLMFVLPAQADKPTFSINITLIEGGGGETASPYTNPISLSGNASVIKFPGQLSQYQVQVDWGDGVVDDDSILNFSVSGDDFSGTWSSDPSHSYANGTYTITVKLYHQNPPGSESGDAQATVTIDVINTPPVAVDDAYSVNEDNTLYVAAPGVLANDSDADNDPLTAILVSDPSNGTLTLNANGSFTYTPDANYNGLDSFTYLANDSVFDSNYATVNITVNPDDDAPVAVDDAYSVNEDNTLYVAAPGVLANDSDADNDPLTAVLVSGPSNGTLTLNANGSFTYTPDANYNGLDSFTYLANDSVFDSNYATVNITVNPVINGGGGGWVVWISPCSEMLTVDFLGEITETPMTRSGVLCDKCIAPSPDGMHLLEIEEGTRVLDSECQVVNLIEITEATASSLPANTAVVGSAYDFTPSGLTFDELVMVTLSYNVSDLPEDALALSMAYHSIEDGWIEVETESSQVADIGSLTGTTDHFTVFAILADLPAFEVSNLFITTSSTEIWDFPTFAVRTGEEAVITVDLTNTGKYEASYTVNLIVNGETRDSQEATLLPGQSEQVLFTVSSNEPGQYQIVVDDLSGEFASSLWINWWLIGSILGALFLIGLLTGWWYIRREKPVEVEVEEE